METAPKCYEMADNCERQAATIETERGRRLLLEVASKWRDLGDILKKRELASRPSSPGTGGGRFS
jgi:hypothetical protein